LPVSSDPVSVAETQHTIPVQKTIHEAKAAIMLRIGLISDTHGLLRPEARSFLSGCDHIIHAGDICDPAILEQLAAMAPLTAVRGNNDNGAWARHLEDIAIVTLDNVIVCVIHDLNELNLDPNREGIHVVVSGHSHKPSAQERDGVLYINPGSAGPRRFKLPIAAGELVVAGNHVSARTVDLMRLGQDAAALLDLLELSSHSFGTMKHRFTREQR
jgi:putative phosphoesterase